MVIPLYPVEYSPYAYEYGGQYMTFEIIEIAADAITVKVIEVFDHLHIDRFAKVGHFYKIKQKHFPWLE